LERIPKKHQDAIAKLRPGPDAEYTEAAQCYEDIKNYLLKNEKRIFGRLAHSDTCLLHPEVECKCAWTDPDPEGCPDDVRPVTANFAGPSCTGWTALGSQKRVADVTMEAFHIWSIDAKRNNLDFIFIEQSGRFDPRLFTDAMGTQYLVVYIVFQPNDVGFPLYRERLYGVAINLAEMVWLGPLETSEVKKHFLSIFGATVAVEADIFVGLGSKDSYDSQRKHLLALRGVHGTSDVRGLEALPMTETLSAGAVHRLGEATVHYKEGSKTGVAGTFVADISQHQSAEWGRSGRHGAWMPPIARSSLMVSVSSNHVFTPNELNFAMGWPLVDVGSKYRDCVGYSYDSLSSRQRLHLVGNGQHLAQAASWWLYIMAHTVRRAGLERYQPPPMHMSCEDEEERTDLTEAELFDELPPTPV